MSDPAARAAMAPRLSGGVAHAMAVSVASGCREAASSAARSAACLLHRPRSIATQIFRTIWSRSSGKCWPQIGRVHARLPGQFRPGNRGFKRGCISMLACGVAGVDHTLESRRRVGHHGGDAASVLGTVQGAALRSARACARPSGLDGACAQMIRGQLRDGRRMLLPSGTHDASMDPLDGIEERSRVFDPFRTRAISPLVEVHFSRF